MHAAPRQAWCTPAGDKTLRACNYSGMRARATTAALLGVFLLLAAPASPPAAPSASAPLPRVTLVCDSVAAAIAFDTGAKAILGVGVDLYLEPVQGGRLAGEMAASDGVQPPTVIQLVGMLGQRLGTTVIIAVGYNDLSDQYASNMEETLDALQRAGVEHVVWATLHYSEAHHGYLTMNNAIEAAATRHPALTVVDWNAHAGGHPDWFQTDEVHLVGDGPRAMARLFHASLVKLGIPVTAPAPTPVEIVTHALPIAVPKTSYTARLVARGGRPPYRWSHSAPFPSWLQLTADGRLSGTVRNGAGSMAIGVRATDSTGVVASGRIALRVRTP